MVLVFTMVDVEATTEVDEADVVVNEKDELGGDVVAVDDDGDEI